MPINANQCELSSRESCSINTIPSTRVVTHGVSVLAAMGSGGNASELLWDGLIWLSVAIHLVVTPYTKVEESFNLQACHDTLQYGWNIDAWDHLQFPGAVPRSFLGALATSIFALPLSQILRGPALLRLVRLVVGSISVVVHARFRAVIAKEWGVTASRFFAILVVTQFHLPFYMSRTLPNVFALQIATLAHAEFLQETSVSAYRCLILLSLAAAIFRCDLLVLIAPVGLSLLFQGRVNFFKAAAFTAFAALVGACLSIMVDSILWKRWLWPEFEVLWFNTAENKSSEWGNWAISVVFLFSFTTSPARRLSVSIAQPASWAQGPDSRDCGAGFCFALFLPAAQGAAFHLSRAALAERSSSRQCCACPAMEAMEGSSDASTWWFVRCQFSGVAGDELRILLELPRRSGYGRSSFSRKKQGIDFSSYRQLGCHLRCFPISWGWAELELFKRGRPFTNRVVSAGPWSTDLGVCRGAGIFLHCTSPRVSTSGLLKRMASIERQVVAADLCSWKITWWYNSSMWRQLPQLECCFSSTVPATTAAVLGGTIWLSARHVLIGETCSVFVQVLRCGKDVAIQGAQERRSKSWRGWVMTWVLGLGIPGIWTDIGVRHELLYVIVIVCYVVSSGLSCCRPRMYGSKQRGCQ